ncbi:YbaK/EbsC family protein [Erysipelothrix rhusiopathiae]|uniref:YbaK/aminoacyl-tRNA synthetase-associated domain-containing protein n=1 Tax=Erysipelothrix rhusiopathiae ATCC 19414 TaxID=525280 RepID=E7FVU3_ERYRH|nr:YbaK/EbsC family protein [Erysipelothrix rhusiopathiae]UPU38924.1 aminoacyl-tRNA deacylase [Erysipelothrix sp. Poltava]AGN24491.1 YbaK/prolyl-tRNA synthetase-associated domain-containing protein [Erysipelothrix rhusiopathiae SY1027]AMS10767.1 aminoacyl-tRNA deacylase [Erysipelothrix rhusiopathiae]AOO66961.1 aminoacyl-tRNA deacylase [Erysipelothrix rhusiopathiae]AWU41867.1 aminoacyl-tRNA deacylase [Erysipelothrix rhusiopathiae]
MNPQPYQEEIYHLLHELDISYREDHHKPIFSVESDDLDIPGPQVKYLLLQPKKTDEYYLVVAHDETHPDLKQLAQDLGTKRLSFPSNEAMKDLLGIEFGSLTLLSLIADTDHKVTPIFDTAIDRDDTIGLLANNNTITLTLQVRDVEKYLEHLGYTPRYLELKQK